MQFGAQTRVRTSGSHLWTDNVVIVRADSLHDLYQHLAHIHDRYPLITHDTMALVKGLSEASKKKVG